MKIDEILRERERPVVSFEFFPPKTDEGRERLLETVSSLRALHPSFVSVTYGAGGSQRTRTLDLVKRIKRDLGIEAMAHLTCVGSTREELRALLDDLQAGGIENVMALRGDRPRDGSPMPAGDLRYASDLIALLEAEYAFSIGAGAYPEKHPEAGSVDDDIAIAAKKVAAGARFLVTQFFFANDDYFAYVRRLRERGITVPVLPGIMPITSYAAIDTMMAMNGGRIPERLRAELDARREEPVAVAELGIAFMALQCRDLLAGGAPGLHFYTLNKSTATRAIVSALIATNAIPGEVSAVT